MSILIRDLTHALRSLRKTPGFTAIAVLTLALGIGANTAIFSVLNGVLLRPLGYADPDRLLLITSQFPTLGFDQFWVSAPEFLEFQNLNRSFASVGAYRVRAANLGTDQPSRPVTAFVTGELLDTLGVQPLAGRLLAREDTLPGAERVAVLSYPLWQRSFAGRIEAIGEVVRIDDEPTRVVGVMPPGFDVHDEKAELWLPLTIDPASPGSRGAHFLYLIGRLKPEVTPAAARVDLERMLAEWRALAPDSHVPNTQGHRLRYDRLQDDIVRNVRTALWVLQGAVGFVLLIACANLANLLLARSESRQREFAVRAALGASRWRLLRQFLTEGVLVAVAGAAVGVGLAAAGLRAILAGHPEGIPRTAEIGIDPIVLVFTLVVSVLTGVVFGLAPLLHLTARSMHAALKESGSRTTAGTVRARMRGALVVAEVALAVVLVAGAGLLIRSFWNLMQVDAGFERARLVTFGVVLPDASYGPERRVAFFRDLGDRLRAIPGVTAAAAMSGLPPLRQVNANDTEFEGLARTPDGPPHNIDYYQFVTGDYLEAMEIPVVEGRGYTARDADGPPIAMVNETLARTFFPNESAIGRRVRPSFVRTPPWFTIIGVVKDVKQGGVGSETGTELYLPFEQMPAAAGFAPAGLNVVVRTAMPLEAVAADLRAAVRAMDPALPVVNLRTFDQVFAESLSRPRFLTLLLGLFAGLALLLAAVGTYGILSYVVTERRPEIGVRMALGAGRGSVLNLILGQGIRLTAAGLAVGVGASVVLTRLLSTLLFGVEPADPATLAAVTVVMVLVALVACLVPAHRATRVDPMVVLRAE